MNAPQPTVVLFTDLDGCLLNKADYDFKPTLPVLARCVHMQIPVVFASSKTGAEMQHLAEEVGILRAPLICENGGLILWRDSDDRREVTGAPREEILTLLKTLKDEYRFRSFADLGLAGVIQATSLPENKAQLALDRHSTEPLLWDDSPEKLTAFGKRLTDAGLSFTKGGRFWHVAGQATKGGAMAKVAAAMARNSPVQTIAVGDSPIDQSMLDIADFPVGIPAPDGNRNVTVAPDKGRFASIDGALGWAKAIGGLLDQLEAER